MDIVTYMQERVVLGFQSLVIELHITKDESALIKHGHSYIH